MMATLRSFIALLLDQTMAGARSRRKTGTHFSGSRSKNSARAQPSNRRFAPKKEARPKGPGTPYSLRRNIIRNRRKTMRCLRFGELNFASGPAAVGSFGGIDPAQHFLEVVLDRFITKAGPGAEGFGVKHQDRSPPGLQDPFGLEGLESPGWCSCGRPPTGSRAVHG